MPPMATRVRYGDLNCLQVDGGDAPEVLVVTLHGYGAPGEDLVPIAGEWTQVLGAEAEKVRFVFPAALHSLDSLGIPGGRAWWPLNMQRLLEAVEARDISELRTHEPPGMDVAREAVSGAVGEMLSELGSDTKKLVLGGFSQGAMLAMDVAARGLSGPPAGLFLYSGALLCEAAWKAAAMRLINTPTVQSHGSQDPILPFIGAEALYELLKVAGVPVEFHPFTGGHTLSVEALDATAGVIRDTLAQADGAQ